MSRPPHTLTHVKNSLRIALGLLFIVATSWLPTPAQACACGALVTDSAANINAETAFVVMNDGRERIDMVMHLDGEASTAAWIMPLPPGGKVSLGDKDIFGRLKELTKPRPRYVPQFLPDSRDRGPQSGVGGPKDGAAPGVQVVDVQTVGPFEVTTLQGTSAAAVNEWLETNGFPARKEVETTFQEYLDAGWQITATRLTPGGDSAALSSGLDSLRMEFPTDEPIYPIKLSRHARTRQGVKLFVLADHRMDAQGPTSYSHDLNVKFAGKVPANELGLGDGERYLTAVEGNFMPTEITDDIRFTQADSDEEYVSTYDVDIPVWKAYPALLLAGVLTWLIIRRYRRTQQAGPVRAGRP